MGRKNTEIGSLPPTYPSVLLFRAIRMVPGGFYLAIAKAISKIKFEQPAFIAAGGPDILSGKRAGGRPM
jgi:hypothetical protein